MKKYDSKELQMMVQEIIIADFTQDFEKMYKTKADLFIRLDSMCEQIDDMQREISFLSGQLEAANNDLRRTQLRLENLKKYGAESPDTRDMYPSFDYHDDDPTESRLEAKHAFDNMFDGCSPDDLPFPDVDYLAPAEELEGSEE